MHTPQPRPLARLTSIALVAAGAGIVTQILSGIDFPTVPPGLFILLVPAALIWFVPWRWMPLFGTFAGLSQWIGLFAAGQAPRLVTMDPIGGTLGLWLQLLAVIVATVAGIAAVVTGGEYRASRSTA